MPAEQGFSDKMISTIEEIKVGIVFLNNLLIFFGHIFPWRKKIPKYLQRLQIRFLFWLHGVFRNCTFVAK